MRTCLHCALARAVRRETDRLRAVGLDVVVLTGERVWLPESGAIVYRRLRQLLRDAIAKASDGQLTVRVLDSVAGKSHVEVTVTLNAAGRDVVLSCACPRQLLEMLSGGFCELDPSAVS